MITPSACSLKRLPEFRRKAAPSSARKAVPQWLEGSVGHNEYDVIRVLKNHFDPDNIMNPGGTLGLDLPEEQKKYLRPDIPPRG